MALCAACHALLISQGQVDPVQQLSRLIHRGAGVQARQGRHGSGCRFQSSDGDDNGHETKETPNERDDNNLLVGSSVVGKRSLVSLLLGVTSSS